MTDLGDADRERIAVLFSELDVDKDGRVSVAELARVIRGGTEGEGNHVETAKRIISRGTQNEANRSTLTFNEFLAYIRDTETQLRLAFRQLDRNHDSVVDAEEIRSAMKDLGVNISLADAQRLLNRMDKDGSLNIDFDEWRNFLLFSGTSRIDEIFQYWKRASAIDIGEDMLVPDDFTEEEKKTGQAWKTLVAGGIAGCVSRTVTAPLDRIKLFWQALGGKAAEVGLIGTVNKMLKEGGVGSLWRGNGVNCLKIAPESAIKFQTYELYKQWLGAVLGDEMNGPVSLQTKFFSGAFAGATAQTIIYPMEVLKTRMCLRKSGQYSSIFDCARKLHHEYGWRIFYRGYVPNMLGILPYAGIELALFETFKQSYVRYTNSGKEGATPPVYVSVTAGALSSVCGQLGTYPLALVRTKLQAQTAGSDKIGLVQLCQNIVKNEGFTGLFRGLGPNMLKVIPAVSVSYACYDQLRLMFGIQK
ncbi:Calcium-binding mitochondrial carrier protein SCaMC-1 [Fasciola gigantica]|uniref:Calcium-binding mitochondrial carrier protein SCaMC-1 n=1 Tax=Fasciola gigantica TaxID=46835 RepID=A0A504YTN4_FASGI|nr:Calcium-binding mitochondrial carrier protein SCaMC-1 [Fasciola gigantica]